MKFLAIFALAVVPILGHCDPPRITGSKLATPPVIDGEISPEEWAGATSVSGGFLQDGREAPEYFIDAKIAYDEKYVYFSAIMADNEPNRIFAEEYRKNVFPSQDDNVVLRLNPFGLTGRFHEFTFNSRTANHINVPGGKANKVEWIGEMDSQGKITEKGWQVEARIPWTVFRLPAKPGATDFRLGIRRYIPRIGRGVSQQYLAEGKFDDMSIWEAVEVPAVAPKRVLKLLPYTYLGGQQDGEPIQNSGFDLKAPLNSGLDLIATVNPDFRNIENSILSLDFSYFERLADESRPFFLEGREFFDRGQSIFRSQRVNNIDFGAKVIGEINDQTKIGLMTLQDLGTQSSTILSLTSDVNDRTSFNAGVAHLDREDLQSIAGYVIGRTRFGKGNAGMRISQHHDNIVGSGNDSSVDIGYEDKGYGVYLDYDRRERRFRPRLGFAVDNDYQGAELNTWFNQEPSKGAISNWGISSEVSYYSRLTGPMYKRSVNLQTWSNFRSGIAISGFTQAERIFGNDDHLSGGGISFPWNDSRRSYGVSRSSGKIGGKSFTSTSANGVYQINSRLRTSLSTRFVEHFSKQTQWIGTASADLGGSQSISTRLVRRNSDYNVYFSYRRSGSTGAEYFVILGDPNARSFRTSLVVKAVFPVEIRF